MSRTLHARWILPFVLLAAAWALWRNGAVQHWRAIGPGLEFSTLNGEPFCRRGSSLIAVVRFDPARVRLRVRHFSGIADRPLSVVDWQRETRAQVVFNAGQYYPDFRYMGLLVSGGRVVSARAHAEFQAALVARRDGTGARVLDLSRERVSVDTLAWGEVAQSFMLFGRGGELRVRRSDRIANRTVVAEDSRGRVLVFVSEGGYTLAEYADVLRHARMGLAEAMSMDGGLEAELVVARGGFRYASFGDWRDGHASDALGARTPLPAVITLEAP